MTDSFPARSQTATGAEIGGRLYTVLYYRCAQIRPAFAQVSTASGRANWANIVIRDLPSRGVGHFAAFSWESSVGGVDLCWIQKPTRKDTKLELRSYSFRPPVKSDSSAAAVYSVTLQ